MIDVLETWLLQMRWNSTLCLHSLDIFGGWSHIILIILVVALAGEVIWSFVLMRTAKLWKQELAMVWNKILRYRSYILIAPKGIVHIT